jgi:hypothetical protein
MIIMIIIYIYRWIIETRNLGFFIFYINDDSDNFNVRI